MREARPVVVTIGEALGLLHATPAGSFVHAGRAAVSFGGAESNVAIGLARLGVDVAWTGRVGDDAFGTRITRTLRGEGVEVHAIVDPDAPTAVMLKDQPSILSTRVTYHRSASAGSRIQPDDLRPDHIAGATVLHVSGITLAVSDTARATIRHAVDVARRAGVLVSFDVNHRSSLWRGEERAAAEAYRDVVSCCDLLFAGEEEAAMVLGTPVESLHVQDLARLGPSQVLLKRGSRGAAALIDGKMLDVPAVKVPVVDTVGAGDAFVAGYLAALVAGEAPLRRLHQAVTCGAFACTVAGDWEAAPTRRDLELLEQAELVLR